MPLSQALIAGVTQKITLSKREWNFAKNGGKFGYKKKVSKKGINMSLTFYERRLLNDPDIEKELQDIYWGISEPHDITVELSNADGLFSTLFAAGEEFRGRGMRLRRYEPNETDSGDILKFELYGLVSDFNILLDKATFTVSVSLTDPILQDSIPAKVYETTDWAETPPLIINPPGDLGKPYNLCFGHCEKVPTRYVHANYTANQYDYIIGYGIIESVDYVYRSSVLVNASEYTIYDGSQGSPYPGFAFVRFALEQKDFNGSLYDITADIKGLKLGGSTSERNFIKVIQNILSNTTWGLSQSINATSFTTAAALVSNLYCDGHISTQGKAIDVLNDLLRVCNGKIEKNESGEWIISIDSYTSTVKATFGHRDGYYDNIIEIYTNKKTAMSDAVKRVIVKYGWNEWTQNYDYQNLREIGDNGEEITIECPYIRNHVTADRMTCYIKNRAIYCERKLGITVGMESRQLDEGDVIQVVIPDFTLNSAFQIEKIIRNINTFKLDLGAYSAGIYTYTAGDMPNDANDDSGADYSQTPPSTPTSFQKTSQGTYQGTDGTTYAYFLLSAVAPATNCSGIQFGYRRTGETYYTYINGNKPSSGQVWSGRIDGLVPGLYYDLVAIAQNIFGLLSSGAALSSQLAPGDSTAPAQVTGLVGSGKYKTWQWTWAKNSEVDLKGYHIQIATDSGFSGVVFDKYANANSINYTDDTRSYGTLYCRVKAVDFTGNESVSWSATGSATTSQTGTNDLLDGIITSAKIADATITNAKIANATITGAKIANASIISANMAVASIGSANIADLAVGTIALSTNAVTSLKRQLVSEQSVYGSIPPGGYAQLQFIHNLGRKVTVTWYFSDSAVANNALANVYYNSINDFYLWVHNLHTSWTMVGTIYVNYW
jgi:uncharacterized protein YjbI with pentapeptide repeats